MFLSINVISANEINDNNLDSIGSSNQIELDSVDGTDSFSSNVNEEINEENLMSDNIQSNDLSENSYDNTVSSEEANDKDIESNIGNSEENKPIEEINNGNADVNTDSENNNNEDSSLNGVSANHLETSKESTHITVSKTSIVRGSSIYIYLKDSHGNPIIGKNLTLTINNFKYTKTTNSNGAVSLKFDKLLGNYTLKVHFNGDNHHLSKTSDFSLHIHQISTKITVSKRSVARGKYLYAYLKDDSGKVLSGRNITIKFRGKNYIKTTDKNGRVALKINSLAGKYHIKIIFSNTKSYSKSHESFILKVYKQKTKIYIQKTSVIRGKYLFAYLKTSDGKPLSSHQVKIKFNGIYFYRTTNKNGRVDLQIKTKLGTFPTTVSFDGSGYYMPSSRSFKLVSYVAKSKIISKNSVVRGKYFYAYLKDQSNNPVVHQKVIIDFSGKKYTRITNKNGRVALKIKAQSKDYSVKIIYAGSKSYKPSHKYLSLKVLPNASAKIIAKSKTCLGEYSIRLTDLNGNPLSGQSLNIQISSYNRAAGSLEKITQKTIVIDTDYIYSAQKDKQYMNNLASALRAKGYRVIISGRGPNEHCNDIKGKYSNAVILCLFGGADSGMFKDMSDKWYQNLLKKYNNRVVLGFLDPPNTINLANSTWLKRAHDDNYSPSNFTGISYPGTYLNNHGMDYIYGKNANEMANNFVNYAVKGLSIGKDNTIPHKLSSYSVVTNANGYATISGLKPGTYTVQVSYSNKTNGKVADTVKVKIVVK